MEMNQIEFVKRELAVRGLTVKQMERDLGFANGYVRRLRRGQFPRERLDMIAEYLDVDSNYLLTCGQSELLWNIDEAALTLDDLRLLERAHCLNEKGYHYLLEYARLLATDDKYRGEGLSVVMSNHETGVVNQVVYSTNDAVSSLHEEAFEYGEADDE